MKGAMLRSHPIPGPNGKTTLYDRLQFFEQLTSEAWSVLLTSHPIPATTPILMSAYPEVLCSCSYTSESYFKSSDLLDSSYSRVDIRRGGRFFYSYLCRRFSVTSRGKVMKGAMLRTEEPAHSTVFCCCSHTRMPCLISSDLLYSSYISVTLK